MIITNPTIEHTEPPAFDGKQDHQRDHRARIQGFIIILLDKSDFLVYATKQTGDKLVLRHRCAPYDNWLHIYRNHTDAVCQFLFLIRCPYAPIPKRCFRVRVAGWPCRTGERLRRIMAVTTPMSYAML